MDCAVVVQGGTLRNDKLKCELGHRRTGEEFSAAGFDPPHGELSGGDVDGMASDGRTKGSGVDDDDAGPSAPDAGAVGVPQ